MQLTIDKLTALKQFGTATIHEAQGRTGALDSGIRPIDPMVRLAGPALTVDCCPNDNLALHYALTKAAPGDVLVVDAKGFIEAGPWGDVLTLAAIQAGIVGLVIDGSVRDANAIIDMGFPVFSRGLCIKGTLKNQPGKVNVPIIAAGVRIVPGDIIVGDRDGLVVVEREKVDSVIESCLTREKKETEMRAQITAGKSTVDILGIKELLQKYGME